MLKQPYFVLKAVLLHLFHLVEFVNYQMPYVVYWRIGYRSIYQYILFQRQRKNIFSGYIVECSVIYAPPDITNFLYDQQRWGWPFRYRRMNDPSHKHNFKLFFFLLLKAQSVLCIHCLIGLAEPVSILCLKYPKYPRSVSFIAKNSKDIC